jgi:hypothetical protein
MAEDKYYSKQNPNGPYANRTRPDAPPDKPSDYIDGKPTEKNMKEWTDYSKRHSDDPTITGKELR